jgi:hypothetical protein
MDMAEESEGSSILNPFLQSRLMWAGFVLPGRSARRTRHGRDADTGDIRPVDGTPAPGRGLAQSSCSGLWPLIDYFMGEMGNVTYVEMEI